MTTHLEDGTLVRYLDDECEQGEAREVAAHLDGCAPCARSLVVLRARSSAFSLALHAADPPMPRARPAPRWGYRAAAAAVVLVGVAGTVRPVRAWIVDGAEALWAVVTGRTAQDEGGTTLPPGGTAATVVSFVPAAGEFTIALAGRQAAGTLLLEAVPGDTAQAAVYHGTGADDLIVLPTGLRIANRLASGASYVVRVPAQVGPVRILVGDEAPRGFSPEGPPLEIDLSRR